MSNESEALAADNGVAAPPPDLPKQTGSFQLWIKPAATENQPSPKLEPENLPFGDLPGILAFVSAAAQNPGWKPQAILIAENGPDWQSALQAFNEVA